MKEINWIMVESGEKLWLNWRLNSRPKDIQIQVQKRHCVKKTIEGYIRTLYLFVSCGLYKCYIWERNLICFIHNLDDLKDVEY